MCNALCDYEEQTPAATSRRAVSRTTLSPRGRPSQLGQGGRRSSLYYWPRLRLGLFFAHLQDAAILRALDSIPDKDWTEGSPALIRPFDPPARGFSYAVTGSDLPRRTICEN